MLQLLILPLLAISPPAALNPLHFKDLTPVGYDTGLDHGASPASVDIHKTTTSYSITAYVADMDTWRNNGQYVLMPASETQPDIYFVGGPQPTSVNESWDSSAEKKTLVYVWVGTHTELLNDPGQIHTDIYRFKGVDTITSPSVLHDPDSPYSDVAVNEIYVPTSGGGGG
jgi:hypothetical protein